MTTDPLFLSAFKHVLKDLHLDRPDHTGFTFSKTRDLHKLVVAEIESPDFQELWRSPVNTQLRSDLKVCLDNASQAEHPYFEHYYKIRAVLPAVGKKINYFVPNL